MIAIQEFISHKVLMKLFCKSQFPHKSVNLFFKLVIVKDELTDLCGYWHLQNDFKKTLCEITMQIFDEVSAHFPSSSVQAPCPRRAAN